MKIRKLRKATSRKVKRVNDYNEMIRSSRIKNPDAYTEPGSMKK